MTETEGRVYPWRVDTCRSCQAPIIWAITERARHIPIDADPAADGGTIQLVYRGPSQEPLANILKVNKLGVQNLRVAHFASCPNADRYRTGRHRRGAQA